ncbi:MAG TPA: CHASE2 domain-containing protein, partial [Bryobacteraceae bacterium]
MAILLALPISVGIEAIEAFKKVDDSVGKLIFAHFRSVKESALVYVVGVTDDDLRIAFHNAGKVGPSELERLLLVIAAQSPRVIGVDFDTADKSFQNLACESFYGAHVIWARKSRTSMVDGKTFMYPVLGGDPGVPSALVALPEEQGVIRSYQQCFETGSGRAWFLSQAMVHTRDSPPVCGEWKEGKFVPDYCPIGYHPRAAIYNITAAKLLDGRAPRLQDQAVLLGGKFHALDEFQTPVGAMNGVELLAQVTETADAPREPPKSLVIPVVYLCALLVVTPFISPADFWRATTTALVILVC